MHPADRTPAARTVPRRNRPIERTSSTTDRGHTTPPTASVMALVAAGTLPPATGRARAVTACHAVG
ncbi:hypothetical protein A5N15_03705 [Rothia kristinae]|uniref:Uncharacterized protein n=1 Tax=Rothia kristinae TaxID=37923 RepID=A0A657IV49_9MICC|nr:hypothetical protein A5N15_03705 [Rothia kristinae]